MFYRFNRLSAAKAVMFVLTIGFLVAPTVLSPQTLQAQTADRVWLGIIEDAPTQERLLGIWTISGRQFATNRRTEFDAVEGRLVAGTCVRVDYRINAFGGRIAEEIDSEPASYCRNSNTDQNTSTGDSVSSSVSRPNNAERPQSGQRDGDGDGEDRWLYAFIDAMPSRGLIGEWTIGGIEYVTTPNTFFAQAEGRFRIGACVDVEYIEGTPRRAIEIKTESSYECR